MEGLTGTIFWAFTDPFIAFMGVMAGVLMVDKKTRYGAAFIIALILEIVYVFIVGSRDFNIMLFAMNIIAAFCWSLLGGFVAGKIRNRRA